MERGKYLVEAKKIMGENFIGPEEIAKISGYFGVAVPKIIPEISFKKQYLENIKKDYILILGLPKDKNGKGLTINRMRDIFGFNPEKFEPCFYNQDWYLKEDFAVKKTLRLKWYLIGREIDKKTRGKDPDQIEKLIKPEKFFPLAVLGAFTFFVHFFLRGEILWKNNFIWCKDKDSNGDRIYIGRYSDPKKINKNGFNIHRLLSIKPCFGLAPEIK